MKDSFEFQNGMTIKKENGGLCMTINGEKVFLHMFEWSGLKKAGDALLYYQDDISRELEDRGIEVDEETFDNIVAYYAGLREENDGGDPDEMMSWDECVDMAIEEYI